MKIQKFKNGNINLSLEKSDFFYHSKNSNGSIIDIIESLYNNEITMNDLYFNQINGYMYLVDFNTGFVYDFSDCYINILEYMANKLFKAYEYGKTLKLYSLSNKESKSLLQGLENGY